MLWLRARLRAKAALTRTLVMMSRERILESRELLKRMPLPPGSRIPDCVEKRKALL